LTQAEWIASLEGEPGTNGIDGIDGTNGIDGANGADGIDGANGANGLDGTNGIDGVNGFDGIDGLSAYELSESTLSLADWLASLKGDNGDRGDDGASATAGADCVVPGHVPDGTLTWTDVDPDVGEAWTLVCIPDVVP